MLNGTNTSDLQKTAQTTFTLQTFIVISENKIKIISLTFVL